MVIIRITPIVSQNVIDEGFKIVMIEDDRLDILNSCDLSIVICVWDIRKKIDNDASENTLIEGVFKVWFGDSAIK